MIFILSPAYPAAWLLFGLLFALAAANFLAISWQQSATIVVYAVPLAWVALIFWRRWRYVLPITLIDLLFVAFVVLLSLSLLFQRDSIDDSVKFARYLPFLVVVPYLCGRLMRMQDVATFIRIILFAGVVVMPLLLLDRYVSTGGLGGRWAYFGQDHGALLAGALLAAFMIALCVRIFDYSSRPVYIVLLGLSTVFLVWVTARGWLLAGLAGVFVTCLSAINHSIAKRIALFITVLIMAGLSLVVLPKFDHYFGRMYAVPMGLYSTTKPALGVTGVNTGVASADAGSSGSNVGHDGTYINRPILGISSCQPFKEGNNSVAMRWVLYREASAMFIAYPYHGVGAARFGAFSCTGPMGFPHSVILQGFAELGFIGGGLLIGLLVLSVITLLRFVFSDKQELNWPVSGFLLALFAALIFADQIYGNYFMSVGTWMMLGIAASIRAKLRRVAESHD